MNNISFFIFLMFCAVKASADFGLDSAFFKHLTAEVAKYPGAKNDKFLDMMWENIIEFFPDSATTPPIEEGITTPEEDYYKCTTESEVSLNLGRMIPGKVTINKQFQRVLLDVYAELVMDKHPMKFKVVFKEAKEAPKPSVPIEYKFTGKNTVKLVLEIPEFSDEEHTNAQCLVTIHHIEVIKVGLPEIDWDKMGNQEEKDFVKRHRELNTILSNDLRRVLTMAIIKALKKKMNLKDETDDKEPELWICASDEVRRAQTTMHDEDFEYSPKYKKFCEKEEIKN